MGKFLLIFIICAVQTQCLSGSADDWIRRAHVVDHEIYFVNVMQELVSELERQEWCNLKMTDIDKDISTLVANMNVTGLVTYTNGFVISIQKIDVHNIRESVNGQVVDNTTIARAIVSGRLDFNHINLGYDVLTNLVDFGVKRYTAEYLIVHSRFEFHILKDSNSRDVTVSVTSQGPSAPNIRMNFRPVDHVTEVLTRGTSFHVSDTWTGFESWRPKFNSIVSEIVNRIDYPKVCFNRNC